MRDKVPRTETGPLYRAGVLGHRLSKVFGGGGSRIKGKKNHHHLVGYFKLIYHSRVSHKKHISKLFPAEAPSGLLTCVCSCITATKNKAELNFMDNVFIREAD